MVEIVCIMLDEILNTQVTSCFYIIVLFLPSWKSFIVEKHSHWTHSTSCLAEVGCCWKHGIRPDRKKTSKLFRPIWWLFDQIFQDWEVGGDCWLRHVFEAWVEVKQCVLWARFPRQNQCSNRSSKRGARKHPTGYIYCGGDGVRINEPSKNMANMIQSGFTVTPAGHENTSIYTSISNILSDPSSLAYHLIVHPLMTSLFFADVGQTKHPQLISPIGKTRVLRPLSWGRPGGPKCLESQRRRSQECGLLGRAAGSQRCHPTGPPTSCNLGERMSFFFGTEWKFSKKTGEFVRFVQTSKETRLCGFLLTIHYGCASKFLVEVTFLPHGFYQNDLNLPFGPWSWNWL